ncbi:MAG: ABC transporter ATP-binding protein [Candidatus Methanomethylophilaceae archaeon]|jgi:iron complex transport system ATP-binding protein|nr:ABC transporter ATP-binding protein [Candidatus Methanomethylophilaceae archaeon]
MTKIELKDVSFGYSQDKVVLRDVNLTIEEPGLYCIVGPNGVGKSTIVKCLNKINVPQQGKIYVDDVDIETMHYKELSKKIGYVPVFSQDAFSMSVVDTILVGRYNHSKDCTRSENLKKVFEAMKLLHVEGLAYKKFNQISAGQHQKVAIARGIVQETPVLILDEPTANLDVKYQVYVMEMLRTIAEKRNMIVLTISHDLNITAKYAHNVIMLSKPGVIFAVGPPKEVLTADNITQVYGVRCRIIEDDSESPNTNIPPCEIRVPHIILGEALVVDDEE